MFVIGSSPRDEQFFFRLHAPRDSWKSWRPAGGGLTLPASGNITGF
jgi:hypothetical protein